MIGALISQIRTLWTVLQHTFTPADTVEYPAKPGWFGVTKNSTKVGPYLAPRYRGRIVLTRDPDGVERCVACNLCAVVCPADCIALQKTEDENGRWYPEFFRINFSRCIMCGFCEEACPTYSIQLTPDFEMCEYDRQNLVYEKDNLLIDGPGKYPDYSFYRISGMAIGGKGKGEAENEAPPADVRSLLP